VTVIIDSEVTLAQLAVVGTVDSLNGAVTEDPAVFLFVGALVGMFLGGVVGDSANVAADIVSQASALLCGMREDVTVGALFERGEFAHEAHG